MIEEIEDLEGYIDEYGGGGSGDGGGTEPPIIMGGYHLNTVDIRTLTISDLINTSKSKYYIAGDEAFVVCSAEGGTGSYTYEVYVEGDGYADGGEEIAVSDNAAVIVLNSGCYKIWSVITDSVGVKSTQYFLIDHY